MPARRAKKNTSLGCGGAVAVLLMMAAVGMGAWYLVSGNPPTTPSVTSPPTPQLASREPAADRADRVPPRLRENASRSETNDTAAGTQEQVGEESNTEAAGSRGDEDAERPAAGVPSHATQPANPLRERPTPRQFNEISRGDANSRRIALTFDAGADSRPVPEILAVLASHRLHCTFFLTGKWVKDNPELTRRIAAQGHEIGNHTYSHRSLPRLSQGEIVDELRRTDALIQELTGRSTKPLMRTPGGSRDRRVLRVLADEGYRSIYWDVDSWDAFKRGITATEIKKRVLDRVRNGSIVLMHCGSRPTATALDDMLRRLEAAGYEPVTVSELIDR